MYILGNVLVHVLQLSHVNIWLIFVALFDVTKDPTEFATTGT